MANVLGSLQLYNLGVDESTAFMRLSHSDCKVFHCNASMFVSLEYGNLFTLLGTLRKTTPSTQCGDHSFLW